MRRFLTALAATLPLSLAACGTTSGTIVPLEVPDGSSAEQAARDALRDGPDDPRAHLALAVVLSRQGAHDEAMRLATRAAGLAPRDPEIARWQGRVCLAAGRPIEAYRAFNRALDGDPEWRAAYGAEEEVQLIDALAAYVIKDRRSLRDVADARFSSEALSRARDAGRLFDALGLWRAASGSHASALEAFARATGVRDDLPLDIARSHLALRQTEEATRVLDAWAGEADAGRLTRAGELLEEKLAFDEAERTYSRALALSPSDRSLALRRATVLLKGRKKAEAEAALTGLVSSATSSAELLSLGQLALRFGSGGIASTAFAAAVTLSPDDRGLWKVAVKALADAGREKEIEAIIGMPDRHAAWGDAWLELRQPEKALVRYEAARKAPSPPTDLALRMARAQHQLGKAGPRDALVAEYMAASGNGVDVAAFYEAVGESRKALDAYRSALQKAPKDRALVFAVAKAARDAGDATIERQTLEAWAAGAPAGADRAASWLAVGEHWAALKRGGDAALAFEKALAEGETPSRRPALLVSADTAARLQREPGRAESLYRAWVEAAPPAERAAARRHVAELTRNEPSMARLQSRLLEDVVSEQPDDSEAYANLADAYLRLRPPQRDAAERALRRFVDLSQDRKSALLRAGARLEEANAISEAARTYAGLEAADVPEPERLLGIARVLQRTGDARSRAFVEAYLAAVKDPPRSVRDELFRMAGQLVAAGAAPTAVRMYEMLLPGEQNRVRILKPLGDAQLAAGDEAGAAGTFDAYIVASGRSFQAIAAVGDAFRQRRAYARARTYYEAVFDERARTRLPRLFPVLFETYAKLGDKSAIRELAKRYVTLTPNPRAYADAARRLREAGLLREALQLYAEAARTQPNGAQYREQEAAIALSLGELDTAVAALDALLVKDTSALGWVRAAQLLASRGQDAAARALLDRGLAKGVKGGSVLAERGRLRLRAGDVAGAQADFVEAVADPDQLDRVVPVLRQSLFASGSSAAAVDILRRILASYPDRHETWLELGDAAALAGRLDEAETLWARYAEKDSRGAFVVGGRLWSQGAPSAARRYYERALSLDTTENRLGVLGELVSALLVLGLPDRVPATLERFVALGQEELDPAKLAPLLEQTGFVKEAVDAYEELVLARPAPEPWYRLGLLRALLGQRREAEAAFSRYLESDASQSERIASSDRGKLTAVRLERTAKILAVWEETLAFEQALALVRAEHRHHPELAVLGVHEARLELATGAAEAGLSALADAARAEVVAGLQPDLLAPVLEQVMALGRGAEALAVLAPSQEPVFALAAASLAARLADTGALRAALEPLLEAAGGEQRVALGRLLAEAKLEGEAIELWFQALEPGRGLGGVDGALRELLKRLSSDEGAEDVESRLSRLVEERGEQSRLLALAYFDVGQYGRAAEHAAAWAQSLPAAPDLAAISDAETPNPWRLAVDCHLRLDEADEAFAVMERLAREASGPKPVFEFAADLFADRLRPDLARRAMKRAAEADHSDAALETASVGLALAAGAREAALAEVARLTQTPEARARLARPLAEALANGGEVDTALALLQTVPEQASVGALEEALARTGRGSELVALLARPSPDPLQAAVRLCAAALLHTTVPVDAMERLAQEAVARRPDAIHPIALMTRAVVALERGDAAAALALLDRVAELGGLELGATLSVRRHASGPHTARNVGYAIFLRHAIARGHVDAADAVLERWIAVSGRRDERLSALTALTKDLGAPSPLDVPARGRLVARALEALGPVRLGAGGPDDVMHLEAELLDASGDVEGAIAVYRDAIRCYPSATGFANNLAYLLARRERDLDTALTEVRRALALDPANDAALDTEGWILHKLGRHDEARAQILKALRGVTTGESPGLAELYYHLGAVERARGATDAARAAFAKAARLDPTGTYGILAAKERL